MSLRELVSQVVLWKCVFYALFSTAYLWRLSGKTEKAKTLKTKSICCSRYLASIREDTHFPWDVMTHAEAQSLASATGLGTNHLCHVHKEWIHIVFEKEVNYWRNTLPLWAANSFVLVLHILHTNIAPHDTFFLTWLLSLPQQFKTFQMIREDQLEKQCPLHSALTEKSLHKSTQALFNIVWQSQSHENQLRRSSWGSHQHSVPWILPDVCQFRTSQNIPGNVHSSVIWRQARAWRLCDRKKMRQQKPFSGNESLYCILNGTMENECFIYSYHRWYLQKIVEVVETCPWKMLQGEIDSVS